MTWDCGGCIPVPSTGQPVCPGLDECAAPADVLKARIAALEAENERLWEALAFARSAIKCGEPWTSTCEDVIDAALKGTPR